MISEYEKVKVFCNTRLITYEKWETKQNQRPIKKASSLLKRLFLYHVRESNPLFLREREAS